MAFNSLNKYEVYNLTSDDISTEIKVMKKHLKVCLKEEGVSNALFNIIFVDNEKIRELNKNYRSIDRETDVISFALEDEKSEVMDKSKRVLGDIYISVPKAKEQALAYGHSLKREISFLAVHGLLHLLGYDHMKEEDEKIMFGKQERYLDGEK